MSGLIFVIVIDWDMRKTLDKIGRLSWNLTNDLEDLDCVDEIALLAGRHGDIQEKTSRLLGIGKAVGLNINRGGGQHNQGSVAELHKERPDRHYCRQ